MQNPVIPSITQRAGHLPQQNNSLILWHFPAFGHALFQTGTFDQFHDQVALTFDITGRQRLGDMRMFQPHRRARFALKTPRIFLIICQLSGQQFNRRFFSSGVHRAENITHPATADAALQHVSFDL